MFKGVGEMKNEVNIKKKVIWTDSKGGFIERLGYMEKDGLIISFYRGEGGYYVELDKCGEVFKVIGLTIEKKRVEDYEGVYFLNKDIVYLLRKCGVIVPKECLKELAR